MLARDYLLHVAKYRRLMHTEATWGTDVRAPEPKVSDRASWPGAAGLVLTGEAEARLSAALEAAREHCAAVGGAPSSPEQSAASGTARLRRRRPAPPPPPPAAALDAAAAGAGGSSSSSRPSICDARAALPAAGYRDAFLEAVRAHQVVVVEGGTGCGKTTQLPQFVLEDAAARGEACDVVVTQPRRISAISVAHRVAEERGEECGDVVGYSIRLDSRCSGGTALLFCTLGVLLRRLESDPELDGVTHVFADEVHERSVESDLLLLALSELRQRRRELRIVLMSATLDTDLFCRYFGGAPCLKIQGRAYPVATSFLEDALELTRHSVSPFADWAARVRCGGRRYSGQTEYSGGPSAVGRPQQPGAAGVGPAGGEDLSPHVVKERYRGYSDCVRSALAALDHGAVNYELAAQVVVHFLRQPAPKGPAGAALAGVLVFLAGAREIQTMRAALVAVEPELSKEPAASWILPLHSSLSPEEQRRVFRRPPAGVRKVVLATNIAETSITIDDIGVVVDTAHVKELRYDSAKRLSSLEDVFISRASALQRRGRAGRVAPGKCVHLITKYAHDRLLAPQPEAEVRRVPLEQLVLRLHASGLHLRCSGGGVGAAGSHAGAACARLVEPPDAGAVRRSVEDLVDLGALERDAEGGERLTPLGRRLVELPLSARVGKLVLLGVAFGESVLDATATVAAALTVGSPLASPFDRRFEAQRAHRELADRLAPGGLSCSDVLAVLEAFRQWRDLSREEARLFCQKHALRQAALHEMARTREEVLELLGRHGRANHQGRRCRELAGRQLAALVSALLCAALFPQVALVVPRETLLAQLGGGSRCAPVDIFVHEAGTGPLALSPVQIHPSSVSAREKLFGTPYLIYHELARTARVYVRDVTPVPPLAIALFAGTLSRHVVHAEVPPGGRRAQDPAAAGVLALGTWIRLAMAPTVLQQVLELRSHLDRLFRAALLAPRPQAASPRLLEALAQLLTLPAADR